MASETLALSEPGALTAMGQFLLDQLVMTTVSTLFYGTHLQSRFCFLLNTCVGSRHIHGPSVAVHFKIHVRSIFSLSCLKETVNTPHYDSTKNCSSRTQYWMRLASVMSFLLATLRESSLIAYNGIYVHSVFIAHRDISMVGQLPDRGLQICRVLLNCANTFEV